MATEGDEIFQGYFDDAEFDIPDMQESENARFKELLAIVQNEYKKGRSSVEGAVNKVKSLTAEQEARMKRKLRKVMTGNQDKRVRDMVKQQLNNPVRVKLIDKLSFTFGVSFVLIAEWVLLSGVMPFSTFYMWCIFPLMLLRLYLYTKAMYQYFLIDFCYLLNLTLVLYVQFGSGSQTLFWIVFSHANGPLVWAIVAWRNSLVFHSLDKTTSLIIHIFPSIVTYSIRWHSPTTENLCWPDTCAPTWGALFGYPLLFYLLWQAAYVFQTDVRDREKLDSNPDIQTSVRYFTSHRSALRDGTLLLCKKVGLFKPKEEFDGNTIKTKCVFMTSQLVYTMVTLIPLKWAFQYQSVHTGLLLFMTFNSIWNGAGFYIDVFSKKYVQRLQALAKVAMSEPAAPASSTAPAAGAGGEQGSAEAGEATAAKSDKK